MTVRGLDGIALHGWQPPYPNPDEHRDAVTAATHQANARMTRIYERALDRSQWAEFADATEALSAAVKGGFHIATPLSLMAS